MTGPTAEPGLREEPFYTLGALASGAGALALALVLTGVALIAIAYFMASERRAWRTAEQANRELARLAAIELDVLLDRGPGKPVRMLGPIALPYLASWFEMQELERNDVSLLTIRQDGDEYVVDIRLRRRSNTRADPRLTV